MVFYKLRFIKYFLHLHAVWYTLSILSSYTSYRIILTLNNKLNTPFINQIYTLSYHYYTPILIKNLLYQLGKKYAFHITIFTLIFKIIYSYSNNMKLPFINVIILWNLVVRFFTLGLLRINTPDFHQFYSGIKLLKPLNL